VVDTLSGAAIIPVHTLKPGGKMSRKSVLKAQEQRISYLWDEHPRVEFGTQVMAEQKARSALDRSLRSYYQNR
jgi:hypothetical protein